MRNKFLNKLIAVSIALTAVTVMIPMKTEAAWINNYYGGFAWILFINWMEYDKWDMVLL